MLLTKPSMLLTKPDAAKHYGAKATGVTLSREGKKFCDDASKETGVPTGMLYLCFTMLDSCFTYVSLMLYSCVAHALLMLCCRPPKHSRAPLLLYVCFTCMLYLNALLECFT